MTTITKVTKIAENFDRDVLSITYDTVAETGVVFTYAPADPYAGSFHAVVGQWLIDNAGSYTIEPYVDVVKTPDMIRAEMPALTSRQFWMAAANIDVDKDVIVAAIKANVPDLIDRKMTIAELEAGTFDRLNPSVTEIMAMLEIPAEQVDALWMWAAKL
ncbi:hypothetical protein IFT59_07720 [Rhizobium sp. CFBP 8752]|uniref:hypothetical protein n=1 Tax=Rhizobium sp. CFBP 8752 TaxID=2775301 RepID=UPI00177E9110|nr:hypothetical protein [Rhizobium sp. CFBP 8752]MBD8663140.1 hypothetical protein [Rhizobium sp. CFBP 8752]